MSVPFALQVDAPQIAAYHTMLLDAYAVEDKVYVLEVVLEGEA